MSESKKEILRLLENLKILIREGVLEEEFKVFASEVDDEPIETIEQLNYIIEEEISCWEP